MRVISILTLGLLLSTCQPSPSLLDQVIAEGTLRVVSRNSPTTFYLGPEGRTGPEYELVSGFADFLGVELDIYSMDSIGAILEEVASGRAHLAAAGLTAAENRFPGIVFGPSYRSVKELLVYDSGGSRPRSVPDLYGKQIGVAAGSSHIDTLLELRLENPDLTWIEFPTADQEELLERVSSGDLDYTVVDSSAFLVSRYFYPEARTAFALSEEQPLAWALQAGRDASLLEAANRFLDSGVSEHLLARIDQRYFQRRKEFDYVGVRTFLRHMDTRLPLYKELFREAAGEIGMDWRLLAAIGYQESHWNPAAVSPTGVKGIMMLTQDTAGMMGVQDRENARESIFGGARYLMRVKDKVPERIPEPDRTWFTLAAYNIGFGHLEDARIITETLGGNPDDWSEVRANLPLLTQKKWYSRVKRGYARGWAPVHYVDNIRSYYEALMWLTSGELTDPIITREDSETPAEDNAG